MVSGCWGGGKNWGNDGGERDGEYCVTQKDVNTDSCVSHVPWQRSQLTKLSFITLQTKTKPTLSFMFQKHELCLAVQTLNQPPQHHISLIKTSLLRGQVPENHHFLPSYRSDWSKESVAHSASRIFPSLHWVIGRFDDAVMRAYKSAEMAPCNSKLHKEYICLYAHKTYHVSVCPCVQCCCSPCLFLFCFQKSPQCIEGLQIVF